MPNDNTPRYQAAVFLVKDIAQSKHFYNHVLGQKIVADFGRNVGFEGGLSIWEKKYALELIFRDKAKQVRVGANNSEIYFEIKNVETFYEKLLAEKVDVLHSIMEHPWGQRAFRVYDPDKNILEFAEPMSEVVLRLHREGLDFKAISEKSLMPIEFIKQVLTSQHPSNPKTVA
jgi:catechol 2,3-dioxygenase-like lactoylglutathione lyase family enzyme